ncbi:MAG TPA: hypothetical protein VKR53_14585 [Puia sp.]|nr:hypothetical protein [Puia sp.]
MQSQQELIKPETINEKTSLHTIVKKILQSLTSSAAEHSSLVMNDIPCTFMVDTDQQKLSSLLSIILSKIILQGKESCYRLSARQYSNTVLLSIKNTGSQAEYENKYYSEDTHELCQTLGGCISINEFHNHSTSVTFSFRSGMNVA